MVVRKVESRLPFYDVNDPSKGLVQPSFFGQVEPQEMAFAAVGPGPHAPQYFLVSHLTSPIVHTTSNTWNVFCLNGVSVDTYRWFITEVETGNILHQTETEVGEFSINIEDLNFFGEFNIQVDLVNSGTPYHSIIMRQQIIEDWFENKKLEQFDAPETAWYEHIVPYWPNAKLAKEMIKYLAGVKACHELICDYWGYVASSANQTGQNGIPARFLAAILLQEMFARPKEIALDSPHGLSPAHNRNFEIEGLIHQFEGTYSIHSLARAIGVNFLTKTFGVGQINLTNIAMLTGMLAWEELPPNNSDRPAEIARFQASFINLSEEEQIDCFNRARFPKANIEMVARFLDKLKNRTSPSNSVSVGFRYDTLTANQFLNDDTATQLIATEYNMGPIDKHKSIAKPSGHGPIILKWLHSRYLTPFFEEVGNHELDCGGFRIQRGDKDSTKNYEKQVRATSIHGEPLKPYVKNLQESLRDLGFVLATDDKQIDGDGGFGPNVQAAVREFQIYSKSTIIARNVSGNGENEEVRGQYNFFKYHGPISGVVNEETRRRIEVWHAMKWRCPLRVFAKKKNNTTGQFTLSPADEANGKTHYNMWIRNTVNPPNPATNRTSPYRMFVHDLSKHYDWKTKTIQVVEDDGLPEDKVIPIVEDKSSPVALGRFHTAHWDSTVYGQVSMPGIHTFDEMEITPERLIGTMHTKGNGPTEEYKERSTFMVIRAVSELECGGFFDSLTAYDEAIMSTGPCHWTLGNYKPSTDYRGELCAFMALVKKKDPEVYKRAFSYYGIDIENEWGDNAMYKSDHRKYVSGLMRQKDDWSYEKVPWHSSVAGYNLSDIHYYNTWHWFYRFQAATRTFEAYRRRMWDMARLRIREIREYQFPSTSSVKRLRDGSLPKVKDIFTSEVAIAYLYRMHIYQPSKIVKGDNTALEKIIDKINFKDAGQDKDIENYGDAEESSLINFIEEVHLEIYPKKLDDTKANTKSNNEAWKYRMKNLEEWYRGLNGKGIYDFRPEVTFPELGNMYQINAVTTAASSVLRRTRNSFNFYEEGLDSL